MKIFRRGFWPKIVIYLSVILEFALLCYVVWALVSNTWNTPSAIVSVIILWALSFLFAIQIIESDAEESYKIAWLFLVGLVPVLGPLLYLLFAHKHRTKKQRNHFRRYFAILKEAKQDPAINEAVKAYDPSAFCTARYLEQATNGVLFDHSEVTYFPFGDDMFPKMLEDLRRARHYIFIEYFIITPGKMWNSILEILKQKAAEGVDVRVVWDDVGNISSTPVRYDTELQKYGIHARVYGKIKPLLDVRYNQRDHRKIMVIDGHTAYTGGVNLADEYINIIDRFGVWKDNAIRVYGDAAFGYTLLFLAHWHTDFDPHESLSYEEYHAERYRDEVGIRPDTSCYVLPYGDVPYGDHPAGEGTYLSILGHAYDYVYMTTPYLIPTDKLMTAMMNSALSGIDVRLITPAIPDKKLIFEITRSNYGKLLKAGVKIYEFRDGFVHAKTFISDDRLATIGTINLDYRSLYLHLENGTLLIGDEISKTMKADFLSTEARSVPITLETWKKWRRKKWFLWGLLRLIAPFC